MHAIVTTILKLAHAYCHDGRETLTPARGSAIGIAESQCSTAAAPPSLSPSKSSGAHEQVCTPQDLDSPAPIGTRDLQSAIDTQ